MSELGNAIQDSEYINNYDLLMGVEVDNVSELLGRIFKMPPAMQSKIMRKLVQKPAPASFTPTANPANGGGSSRGELEQRFAFLPKDIREGLLKKRLQLVDTRFYTVKSIAAKTSIDLFQGTDAKSVSLGNIASQKIEKDNWFILSAVKLQYGTGLAKESVEFGLIPAVIRNGEFELEAGNKKIVGLMDNEVFNTDGLDTVSKGVYKLDNPKIIEPQVEIKMPMKWGAAAAADSWLKITLIGTSVVPF